SAQDGDSGEQTALGNREPRGSLGGYRLSRVVHFADEKKEVFSLTGIGILGKATWRDGAARFQSKDVEAGKRRRAHQVRGGEQERVIEVFEAQESVRSSHGNDTKEDLLIGERACVKQERSCGHGEDGRDEDARFQCSLH